MPELAGKVGDSFAARVREQEAALSPLAVRSYETRGRACDEEPCSVRTPFQRDRDRILHSKPFRRLKGKTQVFIDPAGDHYRTRMTHTLETTGIARVVARALRLNEETLMQADVKAAGIEFKIDNAKSNIVFPRFSKHDFDIALFAWVATVFPTSNNSIYSQGAGQNYGQFGNAALDTLLTQGSAELDHQKEADDYNAADKIVWDNVWTLPLFQKPTFIAVRNTFVNVNDNTTSEGPFWNSETWGLKSAAQ